MEARNSSIQDLNEALAIVNKQYQGNVTWNREPEQNGRLVRFTLRVKNSKGPGHRLSFPRAFQGGKQHRMVSACWHVHGHFFEALFQVNPNAVVMTGSDRKRITADSGNWQDRKVGSRAYPMMFSELCECE